MAKLVVPRGISTPRPKKLVEDVAQAFLTEINLAAGVPRLLKLRAKPLLAIVKFWNQYWGPELPKLMAENEDFQVAVLTYIEKATEEARSLRIMWTRIPIDRYQEPEIEALLSIGTCRFNATSGLTMNTDLNLFVLLKKSSVREHPDTALKTFEWRRLIRELKSYTTKPRYGDDDFHTLIEGLEKIDPSTHIANGAWAQKFKDYIVTPSTPSKPTSGYQSVVNSVLGSQKLTPEQEKEWSKIVLKNKCMSFHIWSYISRHYPRISSLTSKSDINSEEIMKIMKSLLTAADEFENSRLVWNKQFSELLGKDRQLLSSARHS